VRSALAWFVFIAAAFALPAAAVRVHEGQLFRCQDGCRTQALPKWPSHQIRKKSLPPQSALNQSTNVRSRALAVIDSHLK